MEAVQRGGGSKSRRLRGVALPQFFARRLPLCLILSERIADAGAHACSPTRAHATRFGRCVLTIQYTRCSTHTGTCKRACVDDDCGPVFRPFPRLTLSYMLTHSGTAPFNLPSSPLLSPAHMSPVPSPPPSHLSPVPSFPPSHMSPVPSSPPLRCPLSPPSPPLTCLLSPPPPLSPVSCPLSPLPSPPPL